MFKIITNLLFGEEEVPKEVTGSVEVEDEEWHVVSHQDAVAEEHQEGAMLDNHPNVAVQDSPISQQDGDSSVMSPETQAPNNNHAYGAVHGVLCPPKGLAHAPLSACVQKAKAWAQRHSTSRNAIQRQNRLRQGIQQQAFPLHQPGHRNLCH